MPTSRTKRAFITLAIGLLITAAACGGSGTARPDVNAAALTKADSCGQGFTVRDTAGTMRLTVNASREASEGTGPATFDLAADGWTGRLEIGTGLLVWPCHDVANDFDDEEVVDIWPVVGGTIELIDPIVADVGGGGSSAVRAQLHSVVLETPDGATVTLEEISLVNPRWGFFGG